MMSKGMTVDGVAIVDGLHVWTNEIRVGIVSLRDASAWDDWFDVIYTDGTRVLQNGERVTTCFQGEVAREVYEAIL